MKKIAYEIYLNGAHCAVYFSEEEARKAYAEKCEANPNGFYELFRVEW